MQVIIDGKKVKVEKGISIWEAVRRIGIEIPTLCFHPDLEVKGRCRVCLVEVNGKLMTSCDNKVAERMIIKTNTDKVMKARRLNLELLASNYQRECEFNRLHQLRDMHDLKELRFQPEPPKKVDDSAYAITRDPSKCILCGKCVAKCRDVQGVNAICFQGRGNALEVGTYFDHKISDTVCVSCGQCSLVCPTNAISETNNIEDVKKVLKDKTKHVVVQTAPAVRASIGEEFEMEPGSLVTKKMVTALRKLGFDMVFDTDFGADLTIIEEANELVERIKKKDILPMITSCSPGWINFIEKFYPELLKHLSSCKSPHQMFGAIVKTYYAEKQSIDPKNIVVVSIMPCTAKKYEANRKELKGDVDYVLTTRETSRLMKQQGIDLSKCDEEEFDQPLGMSSGGAAIFGTTGGVMEAALRTAYYVITGKEYDKIDFNEVRNSTGIKEATIKIDGLKLNVAVVNGLRNARYVLEELKQGKSKYHFIEIMACPGGCIGGGGQPRPTTNEIIKKRRQAIYKQDKIMKIRRSHKNPAIIQLYDEFLGKPLGKMSKELLHTSYRDKKD